MRPAAADAAKILGIVVLGSCPLLIHGALATGRWMTIAAIVTSVQVVIVGATMLLHSTYKRKWAAAAIAAPLCLIVPFVSARQSLLAASGIPHALAYLGLLTGFGVSLFPGREALITMIARRIEGPLRPDMIAYTRRVTWAWCFFFAVQLVASLVLFRWAPVTVWSLFVNVLNLPLVVLMFAVEYGYRIIRFGSRPHAAIGDVIRAFGRSSPADAAHVDPPGSSLEPLSR